MQVLMGNVLRNEAIPDLSNGNQEKAFRLGPNQKEEASMLLIKTGISRTGNNITSKLGSHNTFITSGEGRG